jgi:hypothetical protein
LKNLLRTKSNPGSAKYCGVMGVFGSARLDR